MNFLPMSPALYLSILFNPRGYFRNMASYELIKASGRILVNRNLEPAFDFFANPANDPLWRKEINRSILLGTLERGARVEAFSYLSKRAPNHLQELVCVAFQDKSLAVFETPDNAPFYLRSEREVRKIDDTTTELLYSIQFSLNIVSFALGFALPKFIVSIKTNSDLRKYLKQLKVHLEKP
jgi:hypothetical protein